MSCSVSSAETEDSQGFWMPAFGVSIQISWLFVSFLTLAPAAIGPTSVSGQPRIGVGWDSLTPVHLCIVPFHLGLFFQQNDGRLRLSRQGIIFKNSKTGKVDNIQAGELTEGIWRRVALGHGLKLLTKNGHVYKYDGFRESVRCSVAINPFYYAVLFVFDLERVGAPLSRAFEAVKQCSALGVLSFDSRSFSIVIDFWWFLLIAFIQIQSLSALV